MSLLDQYKALQGLDNRETELMKSCFAKACQHILTHSLDCMDTNQVKAVVELAKQEGIL